MSDIVKLSDIRKARRKQTSAPLPDTLSFVSKRKGGGFNYWDVKPTGCSSKDCETGKVLAEEYLAFIGANPTIGNVSLLACIVRDMFEQAKNGGAWSGVHTAFLSDVNGYAMMVARVAVLPA
ncbi:MAG: hypothetical protein DCC73_01795 [Proteobacteria bacterium]|nr:MAG: hypothetical protein DCC73_01795 [Pseudomonadota bacterium]